jgi:hypothetical protein
MKTELKRRDFVAKCFKAGVTCCALAYGNSLLALDPEKQQLEKADLKGITYCGFKCTTQCTLYRATIENNIELRKKAYEEFKWKEKFNADFDPEKVFCYGCKPNDKPLSLNVNQCTVRKCAIAKSYDCCIECKELAKCDKELWKSYPQFKEKVIDAQKRYQIS